MRDFYSRTILAFATAAILSSAAAASTITLDVSPSMVPDAQIPRVGPGNPTGFASDCWQGPSTGKSNFHVRYLADGNYLTYEFPADAATFKISDLDEISYWTKRPTGTPAGRDWWVMIYTRTTGSGDCATWYHERYVSNYGSHTALDAWTQYSTNGGAMTFQKNCGAGGPPKTLAQLKADIPNDLIEMISVQTDSGWNGFDGYVDGLVIKHVNGNVGRNNFGSTFLPASNRWTLSILIVALGAALAFFVTRRLHATA